MKLNKIKINLKFWFLTLLEKILKLKSYLRILTLIFLDIFIITISLLISSVLLSTDNFFYFSFENYKLFYSLILLSIPIYIFTGQYKDLTRFIGSKSLYQIMIRNGILIIISSTLLNFPFSLGFVIWTFVTSISCTLRIILRDLIVYLNNKRKDDSGVLIYGAGAAGARLLSLLKLENKFFVKGFIDDDSSLWGRSILGVNIYPPSEINNLKLTKNVK